MPKDPPSSSAEVLARLDQITLHLRNIDRRDRWRMIGSAIRSVINFAMLGFIIWSTWLVYAHTGDILSKFSEFMRNQATQGARGGYEELLKQFEQMLPKK